MSAGAGGEWGYTLPPDESYGPLSHALAEAGAPRHGDQTPREWVKKNLFANWYSSLFTVVFSLLSIYLAFRAFMFVFVNGQWAPVSDNLELFMVGRFPREDRSWMVANVIMISSAIGLGMGWVRGRARDQAELSGSTLQTSSIRELASSYWALSLFVVSLYVVGVRTVGPWLLLAACVGGAVVGFQLTSRAPRGLRSATLSLALLVGVLGFQMLSGTGGLAWLYLTLALIPVTFDLIGRTTDSLPPGVGLIGAALAAVAAVWIVSDRGVGPFFAIVVVLAVVAAVTSLQSCGPGLRIGAIVILGVATWQFGKVLGIENIDWQEWGGLYMNLTAATAAIVLAFPIGLLLALGRRSKLPAVRWLCTAYIELIRGVPLITLLLMARFFLGFFINTDDPLSLPTRAIAAITLFSAAYIAEIVRGGLQSVPTGQTEAGQSLGLAPGTITRLLILPQALRAVIPAMVGQFISLFKDTSLLVIIAVLEFLGVREVVHSQPQFQSVGIAETLVFVAFGFWAFSFTMSRESQRLERRLGVGER